MISDALTNTTTLISAGTSCLGLAVMGLCAWLVNRSEKVAGELRYPFMILLGSFAAALLFQLFAITVFGNQLSSAGTLLFVCVILTASLAHFMSSLSLPRLRNSSRYWLLQVGLVLALFLSISSLAENQDPQFALMRTMVKLYGWGIIACTLLLLYVASIRSGRLQLGDLLSFRVKSSIKLLVCSFIVSLLLVLSIPIPLHATVAAGTAVWCSCYATLGTRYIIRERVLYLCDCAEKAVQSLDGGASDGVIVSAVNTIDTLRMLLGVESDTQSLQEGGNLDYQSGIVQKSLGLSSGAFNIPDPYVFGEAEQVEIIRHITESSRSNEQALFDSILSQPGDADFIIPFERVRPLLHSQTQLSRAHFSVDLVGASYSLMGIVAEIREMDRTRVPILIEGERGTGKRLFARMIHNVWGNRDLEELSAIRTEESEFSEKLRNVLSESNTSAARKTLVVRLGSSLASKYRDTLQKLASKRTDWDLIVLCEQLFNETSTEVVSNLASALGAKSIAIPPLRERLEDIIYQTFWQMDHVSQRLNLRLKGVEASALREALTRRWPYNTAQLFDAVTLALTLGSMRQEDVVHSFYLPRPFEFEHRENHWFEKAKGELGELFTAMQNEAIPIAQRLGICIESVERIATLLKLGPLSYRTIAVPV